MYNAPSPMRHLALLLLACCGPAGDEVAVGSGITGYAPLVDGGVLEVHQGPQGGFHVYLTLRARGVEPGSSAEGARRCDVAGSFANPCVSFEVVDLDTRQRYDAFRPLRLPLTATGDGAFDLLPPRLVPVAVGSLDAVDGRRLRVRATIDDASGVHAEASIVVPAAAAR